METFWQGRRVVVTGGAGFLGSHLCRALLERGDQVVCLDNLVTGSITNIDDLFGSHELVDVRRDRQNDLRPLAISHGANSVRTDRSPFRLEFDWTGTADPSGYLALPTAIQFMGSLLPGGWPELMATNRGLALAARDLLCEAFAVDPAAPDDMLGSMVTVPLPRPGPASSLPEDASIGEALFETFHIEVPIIEMPALVGGAGEAGDAVPQRFVRISAQRYNTLDQYARLADALCEILGYRSSGAGAQIR
jgi:isopenicillin-N epimerase